MDFKLGETVYHRKVYNHKEPLKIVGIRENELELEGDYSGGTHSVTQKCWLPIKGVSRIYNAEYKQNCRKAAQEVSDIPDSTHKKIILKLADVILVLTEDVALNPEYE